MGSRNLWSLRPIKECLERTGKQPMSVRWVDTDKGELTRSKDKDRDDLFAEAPPLEAKRMQFARAATRRGDGRWRRLMFIDVRKAHLNPVCEDDVYMELPEECGESKDVCGKLGFIQEKAAIQKHSSQRPRAKGKKLISSSVKREVFSDL